MCDNIIDWICDFLTARKYRVKVNCSYSDWDDVTSGTPQGSVLDPLLFLIYINDLIDACSNYSEVYVFADDAKFFRHILILSATDSSNLQYAVDALQKWSRKWLLNLNIKKCHVVSYGRCTEKLYTYSICDGSNHMVPLQRRNEMLDLDVHFDEKLSFREHMQCMLKLIKHI